MSQTNLKPVKMKLQKKTVDLIAHRANLPLFDNGADFVTAACHILDAIISAQEGGAKKLVMKGRTQNIELTISDFTK